MRTNQTQHDPLPQFTIASLTVEAGQTSQGDQRGQEHSDRKQAHGAELVKIKEETRD